MNRAVRITSFTLIGIGIVLMAVNVISKGSIDVALPLLFLVLGGAFFIVVFIFQTRSPLAQFLNVPGAILIALGVILLLNELTGDTRSWIYAWLLLLAAIGVGVLLANRPYVWHTLLNTAGWILVLTGITGFIVLGVLIGGAFMLWLAPIMLVLAGFSLRWLRLETAVPEAWRRKAQSSLAEMTRHDDRVLGENLIEPLSSREMGVIRLIDAGRTNSQIALDLSIAASTVKTHINNIYGKLSVKTRQQAIRRARELGLL